MQYTTICYHSVQNNKIKMKILIVYCNTICCHTLQCNQDHLIYVEKTDWYSSAQSRAKCLSKLFKHMFCVCDCSIFLEVNVSFKWKSKWSCRHGHKYKNPYTKNCIDFNDSFKVTETVNVLVLCYVSLFIIELNMVVFRLDQCLFFYNIQLCPWKTNLKARIQ